MDKKLCKSCGDLKPLEEFSLNSPNKNGKRYRRCHCRPCHGRIRRGYSTPEAKLRASKAKQEKMKAERANGERTGFYIRMDSRGSDRKYGRDNDLTIDFIEKEISKGCCYCGDMTTRMTLDRIDNDIGHTMLNVKPSCVRCNHVRGDMPYEAWVIVARAMKRVYKNGLFGDWKGRSRPWSKK